VEAHWTVSLGRTGVVDTVVHRDDTRHSDFYAGVKGGDIVLQMDELKVHAMD
jgi:hypothetical protein